MLDEAKNQAAIFALASFSDFFRLTDRFLATEPHKLSRGRTANVTIALEACR
jgi:hypothetical protein